MMKIKFNLRMTNHNTTITHYRLSTDFQNSGVILFTIKDTIMQLIFQFCIDKERLSREN